MKVKSAIPDSRIATQAKPQRNQPSNLNTEGRQFAAPLFFIGNNCGRKNSCWFLPGNLIPLCPSSARQQHARSQVLPVPSHNLSKNVKPLEGDHNLNLRTKQVHCRRMVLCQASF